MAGRRLTGTVLGLLVLASPAAGAMAARTAGAAAGPTAPLPIARASASSTALPPTVSADALPTVQVDGVVWAQVTVGNTVYATGSFTHARPAGTAVGSAQEVPRGNLLAFDITTGVLDTTFVHSLNGEGEAIAASPDGRRLYVGGTFTKVDGVAHSRLVAIDLSTGAVDGSFKAGVNAAVHALSATNSTVYAGGSFTAAGAAARQRLAAFTSAGALLSWDPGADLVVRALQVTPDGTEVVVGGSFQLLANDLHLGLGAVDAITGADAGWPDLPIQDAGEHAGITSLSTDGTSIFGSGYSYAGGGNFEGRFSLDPTDGALRWMNSCHGDTYSTFPVGGVLYSASHEHDCSDIGSFWQDAVTNSVSTHHRVEAETVDATGTLRHPYYSTGGGADYDDFAGEPSATQLDWYPTLTPGIATGQAAWSVTGTAQYLSFGGDFPTVNGVAQQAGTVRLSWRTTWDQDDPQLTYRLYRDGVLISTQTITSTFWQRPAAGFTDTGLTAGSSHTYRLSVRDPSGNTRTGSPVVATVGAATPRSYVSTVLADGPSAFWALDESGGPLLHDAAGYADLSRSGSLTAAAGPSVGSHGTAFVASSGGAASAANLVAPAAAFSLEAWVSTTSTAGGVIVGDGMYPSGSSHLLDRVLYLSSSGRACLGELTAALVRQTACSPAAVNDGLWHHLVVTADASGARVYVDGALVTTKTGVVARPTFGGFWRVGGDDLTGYSPASTSTGLTATLADVAAYPVALSAATVQAHFAAGG